MINSARRKIELDPGSYRNYEDGAEVAYITDTGKQKRAWNEYRAKIRRSLNDRSSPAGSEFTPSAYLVELLKQGIEAAFEIAEASPDFNQDLLSEYKNRRLNSDEELQTFLQEQILQLFAIFAARARVQDLKDIKATNNKSFVLPLEYLISVNILIRPAELGNFLDTLQSELSSHVILGGTFSGAWGELAMRNHDLVLLLANDKTPIYPRKEKARVIRGNK